MLDERADRASAAQALCRLKGSVDVAVVAPPIDAERSRLLAGCRRPFAIRLSGIRKRAAEARVLARHALATARGSASRRKSKH